MRRPLSPFLHPRLVLHVLVLLPLLLAVLAGPPPQPVLAGPQPQPVSAAASMIHWGYWVNWDKDSTASLRANIGALDVVAPFFYTIGGDGAVRGKVDPEVVAIARKAGVKLTPMIQNTDQYEAFAPVLNDPALRRRTVEALGGLVRREGYDGIHIDFESLRPEDRAGLNAFLAELANNFHGDGRLATVAIAAKTQDTTSGWAGPYDYASLGRSADFLVLMTYGYRVRDSKPGSTAPIGWVERSAAFATSQIPKQKLILGLAFWAYDWNLTSGANAGVLSANELPALQKKYNGTLGYNRDDESAWLRYTADGQEHLVWYDDARSFDAKLSRVAQKYGFAGFAGWRLGDETTDTWQVLRAYRTPGVAAPGVQDWAIPGGRFFTQTSGQIGASPPRGYSVTDADGVRFWSEHQRLGGVQGVGYPASQRFRWDGFPTQVMQKAVFQWRPEVGGVYFVNVFDEMSKAGKDDWLFSVRSTPRPLPPSFDAGKSFVEASAMRLALLNDNPAIKARYDAASDPLQLYGLPTSRVQDMGNAYVIRLQRAVIQQWKVDVPWAKAGEVTVANGGDVAKEAGMFGDDKIGLEVWSP
jgi:spore germination protein YaaH